MSATSIC